MSKQHLAGIISLAAGVMLLGCADLSGLGGSQHYGCKAPSGVQCQSVSGNYFNSVRATARLPSTGGSGAPVLPATLSKASMDARAASEMPVAAPGYAPLPLRSPPRVLRLWVKAWEDADHDLVDQSYVYVRINQGKWSLDHVQRQVREAYAPLRPPVQQQAAAEPAASGMPAPTQVAGQGGTSAMPGLETASSSVPITGR